MLCMCIYVKRESLLLCSWLTSLVLFASPQEVNQKYMRH